MASLHSFERLIPMKLDHSDEAIGPDHSGLRRDRTYFDAIADVPEEFDERRHFGQGVRPVIRLNRGNMNEAHAVGQSEARIAECVRLHFIEFGKNALDQGLILAGPFRFGLVADNDGTHRSSPWQRKGYRNRYVTEGQSTFAWWSFRVLVAVPGGRATWA